MQAKPQASQGCRERWVIWHSYANGVPISKTEVAITLGDQAVVIHPRFRLDVDERRREPITLRATCSGRYMARTWVRRAASVGRQLKGRPSSTLP
jgi:hypothetical protein